MTRATSMLEDLWHEATFCPPEKTEKEQSMLEDWAARDVSAESGIPLSKVKGAGADDPRWEKVWARSAEIHDDKGDVGHNPAYDQQAFREIFG